MIQKNNSIFRTQTQYKKFLNVIMEAAENDALPLTMIHGKPDIITVKDIHDFIENFEKTTGLKVDFRIYMCDEPKEFRAEMTIDYPDDYYENEEEPAILQ